MNKSAVENYQFGDLIYSNPLESEEDVKDFVLEGQAEISFEDNKLRLANALDPVEGQDANFVYWCPEDFPSDIGVRWNFWPRREPGLCILFFAATGLQGESIFVPNLTSRKGVYSQYHSGDINAYHVSYFRRKQPDERIFHTCNMRKSKGFHLVSQGADPIPSVEDAAGPYEIMLVKYKADISFYINDLLIFNWHDDGQEYGPVLGGGKIGFRQMAPLIGEYNDLKVYSIEGLR